MTTLEVANRLVELCREGQIETAQKELYAQDCVSTEPDGAPVKEAKGMDAMMEKTKMFMSMIEEHHGSSISEPVVAGDHFSIAWKTDWTVKNKGRETMDEICVYKVKDDKIVAEQFFY